MSKGWIVVIFERRSTVDASAESGGAVDLLSDSNLGRYDMSVCSNSISIVALVADVDVWITSGLGLTDLKIPWRSCINGEQSIEWSNQSGRAIRLKQDTIQDWASLKWGNCCCF